MKRVILHRNTKIGLQVLILVVVFMSAFASTLWGQEIEWIQQFGGYSLNPQDDRGQAVDADGNVYVVGYTYGILPGQTSAGDQDVFVRKYDAGASGIYFYSLTVGDSFSAMRKMIVTK